MKVLLLPSWYPDENNFLNGVFFKEQAEALVKEGIEVVVLSINIVSLSEFGKNKINSGLRKNIENGVTVYRYYTYNYFPRMTELYLRYYSHLLNKLIKPIIRENPNIELVHIHSAIDAGIAYSKSKISLPYIITEHSSKYQRNILNESQKKYLSNVFNGAKKVITVGDGLREAISKYIDIKKVEVIPNLVSLNREITEVDNKKEKFRFFSLGVLTRTKGMDLLIEAFNDNKERLSNCEVYIGGDGMEYSNLKRQIKELNLQDSIKLLGKLDRKEVAYHMSNCDVFVLASRFETFGIVFLEAMIYGKPVIGSRTGGPDTFINSKNGITVEVENIKQLGEALVSMYENQGKYDSEEIYEYCNNNFNEKVVCNKIINIYEQIAQKV